MARSLDFVEMQNNEATTAMASIEDAAECGERADALVRGLLARVMNERRTLATAMDYVRGLSEGTRANAWELARKAGHEGPHLVQSLLGRRKWRWEPVRAALPQLAQQVLLDDPHDEIGPELALDENRSPAERKVGGVRVAAARRGDRPGGELRDLGVHGAGAAGGQAWVDFDVYMPDCWAKDPQRRKKAGIPGGLAFATKPELALEQVKRLVAGGLRVLWAAADEVYGRSGDFRAGLRALGLSYVAIVPCDTMIAFARNKVTRADQAIHEAVFDQRSCGNGAKGPRYADWALLATQDPEELLLIRRLPDREKNQYTFYLCHAAERRARRPDLLPHHRRPQMASRNHFQDGKGRLRLGSDPGAHLGRPQPAHRPDRPRPAQGHRHPVVPVRRRRPPAGPGIRPGQPPRPAAARSDPIRLLRFSTGDAPVPATAGQPCPPGIPPIALSPAEACCSSDSPASGRQA